MSKEEKNTNSLDARDTLSLMCISLFPSVGEIDKWVRVEQVLVGKAQSISFFEGDLTEIPEDIFHKSFVEEVIQNVAYIDTSYNRWRKYRRYYDRLEDYSLVDFQEALENLWGEESIDKVDELHDKLQFLSVAIQTAPRALLATTSLIHNLREEEYEFYLKISELFIIAIKITNLSLTKAKNLLSEIGRLTVLKGAMTHEDVYNLLKKGEYV